MFVMKDGLCEFSPYLGIWNEFYFTTAADKVRLSLCDANLFREPREGGAV